MNAETVLAQDGREETAPKEERPWRVVFYNDDYTPMDFVTAVLVRFFNKRTAEAEAIMLQVHHQGSGTAGEYTKDIALTKVDQACEVARLNGHPLLVKAGRT